VEEDFVLESEKDTFVEELRSIVKRAQEILLTHQQVWFENIGYVPHGTIIPIPYIRGSQSGVCWVLKVGAVEVLQGVHIQINTLHDQKYARRISHSKIMGINMELVPPFAAITASTLLGKLSTRCWNIDAGTCFHLATSISEVGH
jgi:hypothetical protein